MRGKRLTNYSILIKWIECLMDYPDRRILVIAFVRLGNLNRQNTCLTGSALSLSSLNIKIETGSTLATEKIIGQPLISITSYRVLIFPSRTMGNRTYYLDQSTWWENLGILAFAGCLKYLLKSRERPLVSSPPALDQGTKFNHVTSHKFSSSGRRMLLPCLLYSTTSDNISTNYSWRQASRAR
jgi:hypothetical protein